VKSVIRRACTASQGAMGNHAFSISKKTAAVDISLLKFKLT
jgi:hypothetical protein